MISDWLQAVAFYALLTVMFGWLAVRTMRERQAVYAVIFGGLAVLCAIGGLAIINDWLAS